VGAGGHAESVLELLGPAGRLYGIDCDPNALAHASERLARFGKCFVPVRGNHTNLAELVRAQGVYIVDGVVADLGVSSLQLGDPDRGFSFQHDGPLDMRMDPDSTPTAEELLASVSEVELERMLRAYGEEKRSRAIAREIVRRRRESPIRRTTELASLVARVAGSRARAYRIHPATRTFQALRIAVNHELDGLERLVRDAVSVLRPGGRMVVISFHSLEDRSVKQAMRSLANRCVCPPDLPVCCCGRRNLVLILTPRPLRPRESEVKSNPRARSAQLRALERR
jgi:16S rRNA (cytosine1402-N4)-methyltransferase